MNQSGIIPIIFASSVLLLPVLLTNVIGSDTGWRRSLTEWVDRNLVSRRPSLHHHVRFAHHRLRLLLQLDRFRSDASGRSDPSSGWVHPRYPSWAADEAFLGKVVNRITLPGALFVAFIAILPYIVLWIGDVQTFPFAGTTVLIAVGVALELMRQIDAQLMLRNYEGFLK